MDELTQLRLKLKSVERDFLLTHCRKPTKEDIKDFDPDVRDTYKRYSLLKCRTESVKATPSVLSDVWGSHLNKGNRVHEEKKRSEAKEVVSIGNILSEKLKKNAQILLRNEKLESEKKKEAVETKEINAVTLSCLKPLNYKISAAVKECVKAKPINIFGMKELKFPLDNSSVVESSFDISRPHFTDESISFAEEPFKDEHKLQAVQRIIPFKEENTSELIKDESRQGEEVNENRVKRIRDDGKANVVTKAKRLRFDDADLTSPSLINNKTKKMKTAASENYVRINLKKKVYCRGKKKFNMKRYKMNKWKELKQTNKPFKEARNKKTCSKDASDSEDSSFETYLEAVECKQERMMPVDGVNASPLKAEPGLLYSVAKPYYNENEVSQVESEVRVCLRNFGYDDFRPGQLEAILRVLAGVPALVIQPTGAGKSLCYLVPALMYARRSSCITLVISPLVSLMEDQLSNVPSCLRAACLHTNMTERQREKIRGEISEGKVELLFISPESLVGNAGSPFGCLPPAMPPIAFVCIDEVHCVSTWSHNFRPCYLRLSHVVREVLGVKCILGLTATATVVTVQDICRHIGVDEQTCSAAKATEFPPNLRLTVSRDHSEKALLELLQSEPFVHCDSIIIYCIRREMTQRLAILIRTYFQEQQRQPGVEGEWSAEAYHAGLTAARRRSVQRQFMQGQLRVMVATVAFGMGVNKLDVRAVIHYDLPKSMESYVQEIGRAGRDGNEAFCHVFLDTKGEDRRELKRHIYSDTVDRATVRKLLECVYSSQGRHESREVAFAIEDTVAKLDLKQEGIETLLSYLELHPHNPISILNCTYGTCKIYCYGETTRLSDLAATCPAIAMALQMKRRTNDVVDRRLNASNMVQLPLFRVAEALGCGVVNLRRQLKKLQWEELPIAEGGVRYQKTGVVVEFSDLCFHLRTNRSLTDDDIDTYIDYLHQRIINKEKSELEQLQTIYDTMHRFSFSKFWLCEGDEMRLKSEGLRAAIHSYFHRQQSADSPASASTDETLRAEEVECVRGSVRQLLSMHHELRFTGRAVARIFHGISSPNFPALTWARARQFWRIHLASDFNAICQLATQEIINRK